MRRTVAIEGQMTVDGRYVEVGALRTKDGDWTPVMAENPQQSGTRRVVGYAGEFQRAVREDGVAHVSFELHITAKSVLKEIDSLNVNIEVMDVEHYWRKGAHAAGDVFVVKDAVIMGLYVTDQENAWSELNVERAA